MKVHVSALAVLATGLFFTGAASAAPVYATKIDVGRNGVAGTGFEATTQAKTTIRSDPRNALGAPDQVGNTEGGFFSLGLGGVAVFGFGVDFRDQATVFEVTFGCDRPQTPADLCFYGESVSVYALSGNYTPFDTVFGLPELQTAGFTLVGSIPNGIANLPGGASIAISGPFSYLALVDTSPNVSGRDGFDVDAVSVNPVPLPAAAWLLLAGFGGLGLVARRRKAA